MKKILNRSTSFLLAAQLVLAATSCYAVEEEAAAAAEETLSSKALETDVPLGQSGQNNESLLPEDSEDSEENLFGWKKGVVHPYVAVSGEYTDNLYNLDKDRVENLLITINPGIWLSFPAKKQVPVTLATNNASPGGYQYELEDYERSDKYQVFILGDIDYRTYSDNSELDELLWRLQGMGRYNFASGLSLQILDAYTHNQDRFEVGRPDATLSHVFDSNSLVGTIDWQFTEKFRGTFDLSLFSLFYDEDAFRYLERDDIAYDFHLFFNYSEKTSFFGEYKHITVTYDTDSVYDSNSDLYYLGMTWDSTEKLSFLVKLGLQQKEFDNSAFDNFEGFVFELQTVYRFSEKTKFTLNFYRQNEETDNIESTDKVNIGGYLGYDQELTDKLSWGFRLRYENADYRERYVARDREDDRFIFSPNIDYLLTEWLKAGIGYRYEKRDSTYDLYDYYSNTIFANIKLAL